MLRGVKRSLVSFTENNRILNKIDGFLNGRVFLAVLAVFIFIVQMLGWDLLGFSALTVIFFVSNVLCKNSRVAFSVVCMGIFCVSIKNSPNLHASGFELLGKCEFKLGQASTFYSSKPFFVCATVCAVIVGMAAVYRLVFYGSYKRFLTPTGLLWGIVFMAAAFFLSGTKSHAFNKTDLSFGAIQAATFLVIYFYFAATQDKKYFNFEYIADCLIVIFFFMIALVIYLYATRFKAFMQFNGAWKTCLTPGWGWPLDMGTYITLGIAALFYKVYKGEIVALWFSLIVVGFVALFFTLARGAILAAVILAVIGFIGALFNSEIRWKVLVYTLITAVVIGIVITVLEITDNSKYFFDYFFKTDFKNMDSGRFDIWKQYWKYFKDNMLFGSGFSVKIENATDLENGIFGTYSYLAHNLLLQMLGSCGILGFIALQIHLIQVCIVCFGRKNKEKNFFTLAIFAFLFMSMLDTVFFKAQFTFVYLGLLLVCELNYESDKISNTEKI